MKKGYCIAHVDVRDAEAYKAYVARTPKTIARHGGRFIVRGGPVQRLEGEVDWKRVVVLEFPSVERALGWYHSPEYQQILGLRTANAVSDFIVVEGWQPEPGPART